MEDHIFPIKHLTSCCTGGISLRPIPPVSFVVKLDFNRKSLGYVEGVS